MCELIEALNQKIKAKKWTKDINPDCDVFTRLGTFYEKTVCSLLFHSTGILAVVLYDGTVNAGSSPLTVAACGKSVLAWKIDICDPNFDPKKLVKFYHKIMKLIPKVHLVTAHKVGPWLWAVDTYAARWDTFLNNTMDAICQVIQDTLDKYEICHEKNVAVVPRIN